MAGDGGHGAGDLARRGLQLRGHRVGDGFGTLKLRREVGDPDVQVADGPGHLVVLPGEGASERLCILDRRFGSLERQLEGRRVTVVAAQLSEAPLRHVQSLLQHGQVEVTPCDGVELGERIATPLSVGIATSQFVEFLLGAEGQAIASKIGFVPVTKG